jgi:hypothetical protein
MTEKEQEDIAAFAFSALDAVLFSAVLVTALAAVTKFAWNMVIPDVFGLPQLTLKNAFGLVGLGVVFRFLPVLSKE